MKDLMMSVAVTLLVLLTLLVGWNVFGNIVSAPLRLGEENRAFFDSLSPEQVAIERIDKSVYGILVGVTAQITFVALFWMAAFFASSARNRKLERKLAKTAPDRTR